MTHRGVRRIRLLLILAASGLVVGGLVAVMSGLMGMPLCSGPSGSSLSPGASDCRELVASLSWRAGMVAGAAAVLMILFAVGLGRMVRQDDRDRAERAMEAYRASKERGQLARD